MAPAATTLWSKQHVSPFFIDKPSPSEVWSPTVALTTKCLSWRGPSALSTRNSTFSFLFTAASYTFEMLSAMMRNDLKQ